MNEIRKIVVQFNRISKRIYERPSTAISANKRKIITIQIEILPVEKEENSEIGGTRRRFRNLGAIDVILIAVKDGKEES